MAFAHRRGQQSKLTMTTKLAIYCIKEIHGIEKSELGRTTKIIYDPENMSSIRVIITPEQGLYKDVSVEFRLDIPPEYPAPGNKITPVCIDNIYHPNIFAKGRVCLEVDHMGSMETGYKETLENLCAGLNYIFLHPENYNDDTMPIQMKQTIIKNVKNYKHAKLQQSQQICISYLDQINETLTMHKNWSEYFPKSVIERTTIPERFHSLCIIGTQSISIIDLNDLLAVMIRDPINKFAIAYGPMSTLDDTMNILVKMNRTKLITDITAVSDDTQQYGMSNIIIEDIIEDHSKDRVKVITNLCITSTHDFVITSTELTSYQIKSVKRDNNYYAVIKSIIIPIKYCDLIRTGHRTGHSIAIKYNEGPMPKIRFEYNLMVSSVHNNDKFENVTFDTIDNGPTFIMHTMHNIRVYKADGQLPSHTTDDVKKYIASSSDDIDFDISRVRHIH